MSETKIDIHTDGGTVIAGGTFTGVEFVAKKYVYNNGEHSEPEESPERNEPSESKKRLGRGAPSGCASLSEHGAPSGCASLSEHGAPSGCASLSERGAPSGCASPTPLSTPLALEVMGRMVSAGVLNEEWQPLGLSIAEKGVLASCLATRLDIAHVWQTFATLWGMKPETLRTAFNKGMDQRKTAAFLERVKKVMST